MSARIRPGLPAYFTSPLINVPALFTASLPPHGVDVEPVLGFKLEFEPEGPADCIVIAIHGIAGHPVWSWTTPNERICWLRDMLPQSIPNARIYTYGWALVESISHRCKTMSAHAQDFLNQLQTDVLLESNNVRLPLVFVCHNLGGAVLAEATILATQIGVDLLLDTNTVRGVLFLGAPFHGIIREEYVKLISFYYQGKLRPSDVHRPFTQVLKYIEPGTASLADLRTHYSKLAPSRVYQFYEDGEIHLVGKEQCNLGLPIEQEQFIVAKSISYSARFDSTNDERYAQIASAIYSCAYNQPLFQRSVESSNEKDKFVNRSLHSDLHDDSQNEYNRPYEDMVNHLNEKHPENGGATTSSLPESKDLMTTNADIFHSAKPVRHIAQEHITTSAPCSSGNTSNLVENIAEDIITQASTDSSGLPVGAQAAIAAVTSAGFGVAVVNAHSNRVSAKASMRSAKAAELNANIAERKLLLEMRKELQDSTSSTADDSDSPPPVFEGVRKSTTEVVQGSSSEAKKRSLPLGESHDDIVTTTNHDRITPSDHNLSEREKLNILRIRAQIEQNIAARKLPAFNKSSFGTLFKVSAQPDENKLAGRLQVILSKILSGEPVVEQIHSILPSQKGKAKAKATPAEDAATNSSENSVTDASLSSVFQITDLQEDTQELDEQIPRIILEDAVDETESRDKSSDCSLSFTDSKNSKSPQLGSPMSPTSTSPSLLEPHSFKLEPLDQISSMLDEVGSFFKKRRIPISRQQQDNKAGQS